MSILITLSRIFSLAGAVSLLVFTGAVDDLNSPGNSTVTVLIGTSPELSWCGNTSPMSHSSRHQGSKYSVQTF